MDGRIFRLTRLLFEHLDREWTVERMARSVDLSRPHFQKLFKAETGTTPIVFLRELRLTKARELLETTFLRVKEIRVNVGIPDESHFTRDFKSRYGSTPTECRRFYWENVQTEESQKE